MEVRCCAEAVEALESEVVSEATFSEDLHTVTGTFTVNIFGPDQDPRTDTPVAALPGNYELARLIAVPEPSTVIIIALAMTVMLIRGTGHHGSLLRGGMFSNQNER